MGATVAAAAAAHAAAAAAHQGRFFPLPQPPALPHSGGNHSGNVPGYRLLARSMTGGEAGSRMDGNMGASGGGIFVSSSSSSSVTKQRLRWTPELHERFVDAANAVIMPHPHMADCRRYPPPCPLLPLPFCPRRVACSQKYRLAKYYPESDGKGEDDEEDGGRCGIV